MFRTLSWGNWVSRILTGGNKVSKKIFPINVAIFLKKKDMEIYINNIKNFFIKWN